MNCSKLQLYYSTLFSVCVCELVKSITRETFQRWFHVNNCLTDISFHTDFILRGDEAVFVVWLEFSHKKKHLVRVQRSLCFGLKRLFFVAINSWKVLKISSFVTLISCQLAVVYHDLSLQSFCTFKCIFFLLILHQSWNIIFHEGLVSVLMALSNSVSLSAPLPSLTFCHLYSQLVNTRFVIVWRVGHHPKTVSFYKLGTFKPSCVSAEREKILF